MTKEEILKNAIVGVVCDELDYEHGNFQFYKEEVLQAMEDYAESENERLKAEREWIIVTPETMPKIPLINNYCVENKDLLVLHCLKFDSYEIGFWNGEKWEMPDTGFAELWEVDMYMNLPQPPKQLPKKPICCEKYMRCQDCPSSPNYINPLTNNKQ